MTGHRGDRRTIRPLVAVVGLAGIITIVAGTFAPWVSSGAVSRNLYRVTGVAARLGLFGLDPVLGALVPLIGPVCVLPVVLALLGARRTAAGVALVTAMVCGGFATTVLILAAGRSVVGISLAPAGPIVVLAGAVLVVAAAALLIARGRRSAPGVSVLENGPRPVGDRSH